jgi:cold shock CspA family protein
MATGKISKVVHLSLQSAGSADCSPGLKGYGYIRPDNDSSSDRALYFEAKAVQGYSFDDLQMGQTVEYEADPKASSAKKVKLTGEILEAPSPQISMP